MDTIAAAWPDIARDYILLGINGETPSNLGDEPRFNYTYVNYVGRSTFKGYPGTDRESPALVSEAMAELKGVYPISHYFVGGHSQGGFLTYSLLMNFPESMAGAFPISCGVIFQCEPDAYADEPLRRASGPSLSPSSMARPTPPSASPWVNTPQRSSVNPPGPPSGSSTMNLEFADAPHEATAAFAARTPGWTWPREGGSIRPRWGLPNKRRCSPSERRYRKTDNVVNHCAGSTMHNQGHVLTTTGPSINLCPFFRSFLKSRVRAEEPDRESGSAVLFRSP